MPGAMFYDRAHHATIAAHGICVQPVTTMRYLAPAAVLVRPLPGRHVVRPRFFAKTDNQVRISGSRSSPLVVPVPFAVTLPTPHHQPRANVTPSGLRVPICFCRLPTPRSLRHLERRTTEPVCRHGPPLVLRLCIPITNPVPTILTCFVRTTCEPRRPAACRPR
jgi:hypothetical protein